MWHKVAAFIIKFRVALLVILLAATAFMGYMATKVQLSYQYADAIPRDNPKYLQYQEFRKKFGEDGNTMVIGVLKKDFFEKDFFQKYAMLVSQLEKVESVENILSVPGAFNIVKDTANGKLKTVKIADITGLEH
ncbi:MAG: RND transporter, partial [Chitinophagaceae bacterium]|nr:RND transporter [Chitinophagaceae bacterium]